jgi:hypothetical protein
MMLSCAEKEIIIPPLEVPTTGKHVVVEDLTGVRCPNCPSANARLEAIKSVYGDNVIIIGIHGSLLTKPLSESKYDLRSEASVFLESTYSPLIGKPSVVINRKVHQEFSQIANPLQDQWQTIIERELQLEQVMAVQADVFTTDMTYQINMGFLPLQDYNQELFLHLLLIENNIVDAQEDVDRVIPDYVHNHVLRDMATPAEGLSIGNAFTAQQLINKSVDISFTSIGEQWSIENIEVVLIISNIQNEIIEATTLKLLE